MAKLHSWDSSAAIDFGRSMSGGDGDKSKTAAPIVVDDKIRGEWNKFQDFLTQRKLAGAVSLDNRDTQLGRKILDEYRKVNPSTPLTYDHIAPIQNSLNNYRMNAWKLVQAGKATSDAKTLDEFMPNLSQVDGWLGSKTSQVKFPLSIMNGKVVGFADNPNTLQQQAQK